MRIQRWQILIGCCALLMMPLGCGDDRGDDDDTSDSGDDDTSDSGDDDTSGSGDDDTSGSGDDDTSGSGDDDTSGSGDDDTSGSGDDDTSGSGDVITTCTELCAFTPVDNATADCVSEFIVAAGNIGVLSEPSCAIANNPVTCGACYTAASVSDADCAAAHSACF